MNRFRTRRKAKAQTEAEAETKTLAPVLAPPFARIQSLARPDTPSAASITSRSFTMRRKKSSTQESVTPEPMPELMPELIWEPSPERQPDLDLSLVLPNTNEFRTSLIMPKLSARFSMLREQDDPATKIGKANDDSVLFPKRASRLNLFMNNPLNDINEVASIRDSTRPSPAPEQLLSMVSKAFGPEESGSVMNRPKHGEGKTLFGHRQNIYRFATNSSTAKGNSTTKNFEAHPDSSVRNTLADGDVSQSPKSEQNEHQVEDRTSTEGDSSEVASSPATGFSVNRGTLSSTTSIPSGRRVSTAATSVESHGLGLFHGNESTASVVASNPSSPTKISPEPTTAVEAKPDHQAPEFQSSPPKAAQELADDLEDSLAQNSEQGTYRLSLSKSASNIRDSSSRAAPVYTSTSFRMPTPPASVLTDLGNRDAKLGSVVSPQLATSSFLLTPPVSDAGDSATFTDIINPEDRGKATAMGLFNRPQQQYDEHQYSQRQLQMFEGRQSPLSVKGVSPKSLSQLASNDHISRAERDTPTVAVSQELPTSPSTHSAAGGTDIAAASSTETGRDSPFGLDVPIQSPQSPSTIHPALRDGLSRHSTPGAAEHSVYNDEANEPVAFRPSAAVSDVPEPAPQPQDQIIELPSSPSTNSGLGLGNIIRAHMRHDSERSAVIPLSPRFPPANFSENKAQSTSTLKPAAHSGSPGVNSLRKSRSNNSGLREPGLNVSPRIEQFSRSVSAVENVPKVDSHWAPGAEAPRGDRSPVGRRWQDELKSKHQRGGSTETQKERDAFNRELAERRRRVQENMKSVVEIESRSHSPSQLSSRTPNIPAGTVSALRHKISKGPQNQKPPTEQQAKPTKMLGTGTPPLNGISPKGSQDDLWREEEEQMLQDLGRRPKTRAARPSPVPQTMPPPPPPEPALPRKGEEIPRSRQRSMTLNSSKSSRGDRSSSDVSGRSKSRNGRYKDDLEKAMDEGTGSIYNAYEDPNTPHSVASPPRPSVDVENHQLAEKSTVSIAARGRSESRTRIQGNLDSTVLMAVHSDSSASTESPSRALNIPPPFRDTSASMSRPSTPRTTRSVIYPDNMTAPNTDGRKKAVSKEMISEPTLVSATSSVGTIARHGSEFFEAMSSRLPLMNPRRRREKSTMTLFAAFSRTDKNASSSNLSIIQPSNGVAEDNTEERSTFSDEGEKTKQKSRYRLRKINSEAGHMNAKARLQSLASPPAVPSLPAKSSMIKPKLDGGMF